MTRFDKISPLWQNFKCLAIFEVIFRIGQNYQKYLSTYFGKNSLFQRQNIEKIVLSSGHTVRGGRVS